MAAVAMIGIVVTALINLQSVLVVRVSQAHETMVRVLATTAYLIDPAFERKALKSLSEGQEFAEITTVIKEPSMRITEQARRPEGHSALAQLYNPDALAVLSVRAAWGGVDGEQTYNLGIVMHIPQEAP